MFDSWALGDISIKNLPELGPADCENEPPGEAYKQCDCAQNDNCIDVLYFFHPDHLGSSTFLTDAAGLPNQFLLYLPYSEQMAEQKAAGWATPYQYNGKELNTDFGLNWHAYGARYYDAAVGRFVSVDPLAQDYAAFTPYAYTMNNPINLVDPDGRGSKSADDWVLGAKGIYWDDNAISQATTKAGETYLGEDLTFTFNSYINGSFDGPKPPWDVVGDKLTSTIALDATKNADGSLKSVDVSSSYVIGETGGFSMFKGRDYFPGLGDGQNKSINLTGVTSFDATFEQHASVPGLEAFGLNMLGFDIVNVAQQLNLSLSGNNLSISAGTDVFPSATLGVNGTQLFQYDQPSFRATHGRDTRTIIGDNGRGGSYTTETVPRRPAPRFYNRYKK